MALGLRLWLAPLRLLRVPVDEIALTLLLSLRFMALVTEVVLAESQGVPRVPCYFGMRTRYQCLRIKGLEGALNQAT